MWKKKLSKILHLDLKSLKKEFGFKLYKTDNSYCFESPKIEGTCVSYKFEYSPTGDEKKQYHPSNRTKDDYKNEPLNNLKITKCYSDGIESNKRKVIYEPKRILNCVIEEFNAVLIDSSISSLDCYVNDPEFETKKKIKRDLINHQVNTLTKKVEDKNIEDITHDIGTKDMHFADSVLALLKVLGPMKEEKERIQENRDKFIKIGKIIEDSINDFGHYHNSTAKINSYRAKYY